MAGAVIFAGQSIASYGTKPAGAYVIANVFRGAGISAVVIDHVFRLSPSLLAQLLEKYVGDDTLFICLSTTLLGISGIINPFTEECDKLFNPIFQDCRARAPHATFLIGGSKQTQHENTSLPFHYGVRGQGEATLTAIINHVLYDDPLHVSEEINGVKYVTDKIYGFDGFNQSQNLIFNPEDGVIENETLPIEFGRGCVFKCSFCNYDLTGKNFGDFTRDENVIVEGLVHNYERYGTTRYILTDDTINDSLEKALLLQRVVRRLPFKFEFGGYMRLELFQKHPEMAEIYLECGLRSVNFGIETLNKRAGAAVGKGFGEKAKDVLEFLKSSWGREVAINANFIIGLPHDTLEDLQRQQDWICTSEALDGAFYSALNIRRQGDSLLAQGEFSSYYTEVPFSPEQLNQIKHPRWRQMFQKNLNWKSPIMNYYECGLLVSQWKEEAKLAPFRNSLLGAVSAFAITSLMRKYTLEELRQIPYSEPDGTTNRNLSKIFDKLVEDRISSWATLLLAAPNPIAQLPVERLTPLVIPKTHVFESKIKVHRNRGKADAV